MSCMYVYARNWKYEQEIAGLLWKVNIEDLQGLQRESWTGSKVGGCQYLLFYNSRYLGWWCICPSFCLSRFPSVISGTSSVHHIVVTSSIHHVVCNVFYPSCRHHVFYPSCRRRVDVTYLLSVILSVTSITSFMSPSRHISVMLP